MACPVEQEIEMPENLFKAVNKTCGIDLAELEDKWAKAKEIVKTEYGKTEDDGDVFYQLVTGIFKKMVGKDCMKKMDWESVTTSERVLSLIGGK